MFTGIIEEIGTVRAIEARGEARVLVVGAETARSDARLSDSVAVNGVCLTVVGILGDGLEFDVIPETLSKTNIGGLRPGDPVNLERALRAGDRLGGHFVQGHVDGVGRVADVSVEGEWYTISIEAPANVRRYLIPHGSVTVDGVSLTVARLAPDGFSIALIPHTLENTNLGKKKPGDAVNLEADMLGKYVEALLRGGQDNAVESY
jgi:riboflavin synthase